MASSIDYSLESKPALEHFYILKTVQLNKYAEKEPKILQGIFLFPPVAQG